MNFQNMNDMSTIITRENEERSVENLAAQRQLYSISKIYFNLQITISVIIIVLLSFFQLFISNSHFLLFIATFSILAVFVENLLERKIEQLKEKAAKIQELFDTYVLDIQWNDILCHERPEYHEICNYFKQYEKKHDMSDFSNWYEMGVERVSEISGKIICQKINCNYDVQIRKRYSNIILGIGIITLAIIIICAIFSDITFSEFLLIVVFPALPIIQWTYQNISSNNHSIANLEQLNSIVNMVWNNIKKMS